MVRWTLDIPDDLDAEVRSLLSQRGGDLNQLVSETLRMRLLKQTVSQIRDENQDLTPEQAIELANEAVDESRASRP